MHSLQALALMQEKRMARVGSWFALIQRSPSSTDCPGSNGTSWCSQRPAPALSPRQILSCAMSLMRGRSDAVGAAAGVERNHRLCQPCHLVDAPFRQHAGEILALVRAAALGARRAPPSVRDVCATSSMLRRSNHSSRRRSKRRRRRADARRARRSCRAIARARGRASPRCGTGRHRPPWWPAMRGSWRRC